MTPKEEKQIAAEIDEAGDLDAKLNTKELKDAAKRLKQLTDGFKEWFALEPAENPVTMSGNRYVLTLSARSNKREFKPGAMRRLARVLKHFYALCSLTLKDFDDNIPADERSRYVEEGQTGPRKVELIAKGISSSKAA